MPPVKLFLFGNAFHFAVIVFLDLSGGRGPSCAAVRYMRQCQMLILSSRLAFRGAKILLYFYTGREPTLHNVKIHPIKKVCDEKLELYVCIGTARRG